MYKADRDCVVKNIDAETALIILMEECAELIQACAKVQRIMHYHDPFAYTPIKSNLALDCLAEQVSDVLMAMEAAQLLPAGISTSDNPKWRRWRNRAKEAIRSGYAVEGNIQ